MYEQSDCYGSNSYRSGGVLGRSISLFALSGHGHLNLRLGKQNTHNRLHLHGMRMTSIAFRVVVYVLSGTCNSAGGCPSSPALARAIQKTDKF